MRILIADDELMSRRLLEKTMQRAGYEVTAVANGQLAAAELCKPEGPRLALLDWIMPELDGPGVCREVRKRKDQSYVYMILLTSKEKKEDVVAGLESGADDYLTKPFDPEELKARLLQRSCWATWTISKTSTTRMAILPAMKCLKKPQGGWSHPYAPTILWVALAVRNFWLR